MIMLDSDELNLGSKVIVSRIRLRPVKILGVTVWSKEDKPEVSTEVNAEQVKNRRSRIGSKGTITGWDLHGAVRIVTHADKTEAAYYFDELDFDYRAG